MFLINPFANTNTPFEEKQNKEALRLKDPYFFVKYQSTGNDFILTGEDFFLFNSGFSAEQIQQKINQMCDRRFGIGADGFICLQLNQQVPDALHALGAVDFKMIYYNADGRLSSMCGNGGRAAAAFSHILGWWKNDNQMLHKTTFEANNKLYHASLHAKGFALVMNTPTPVEIIGDAVYFTDTGSPHVVIHLQDMKTLIDDAYFLERALYYRHHTQFEAIGGTNVNFMYVDENQIIMRTYERGVEGETLSCGTGTVAVSWVLRYLGFEQLEYAILTKGGNLWVNYSMQNQNLFCPQLIGGSECVFTGTWMK